MATANDIGGVITLIATVLLPAVVAAAAKWRAQRDTHVTTIEGELATQRRRIEAALRHIAELREAMSLHGIDPPELPADLTRRGT